MKINKLRIKNINSLKNEHSIDFTAPPLSNSGLFAITGPTGSGKTTILDALCLALFNRIPRINAAISKNLIEQTGVIVAKNSKDAYAEVEFSCVKGIYTSRWEISTNRNGNLRDYEMRLFDASGKVIEEKKTIVPVSVEQLIGLNFEQFTRSIMLPQGDFAQFLKSGKHDRGKLLEKITGSFIYRQLGQKAYQRSTEVKSAIEMVNRRIGELELQKIDDEGFAELNTRCNSIEKEQAELQEQVLKSKKQLEIKQAVQRLSLEVEVAKKQRNEIALSLTSFNETSGVKITNHQQLSPYFSEITAIQQVQKQADNSKVKLASLEMQQIENKQKQIKVDTLIRKLIAKLDNPTGNLMADLDSFEKQVKDLHVQRQQKEFEYRTGFEPLARFAKEMAVDISMKEEPQKISEKVSLLKQSTLHLVSALEQKYPQIAQEATSSNIEQLNTYLARINDWDKVEALHVEQSENLAILIKKRADVVLETDAAKANISAFSKLYEEAKLNFEVKSKDLIINKLQAKLEDVRQQLKTGEPCPVCGSTEHPWAGTSVVEISSLEKEVTTLEKQREKAKSQLDSETAKIQLVEKQKVSLDSEIAGLQLKMEHVATKINQYRSELPDIAKQLEPKDAYELIKSQITDFQKYITIRADLEKIESIKSQLSQLILLFVEGKEIRGQIQKIYGGTSIEKDCKELRDSYIQLSSEKKRFDDNINELKQDISQTTQSLQQSIHSITPKLNQLGYENIESAVKNILPHEEFTSLTDKKQAIEKNLTAATTKQNTLIEQLQNIKKQDIEATEKELADKVESDSSKLKQLVGNRDTIKEQLNTQNNIRKEFEKFGNERVELKQKGEKWVLLNDVIGDATGNKFNNFAQSLTLKHLINTANRRMAELNPRYRLETSDESDDDAIRVVDLDMGNQTRSVKTLSGGETFLVSLALALGMADMASRNIAIGSLFIDEGFGTLDPETLDQALAMLESLQAKGNKTIGIISHVETLKERINARIDLVPVIGHGYSKITMIP